MLPPDSQVPATTPAESPVVTTGRPPRRRRRLATNVLLAVVLSLAAVLAAVAALDAVDGHSDLALSLPIRFFAAAPPVPADWQTYRDPAGLFSIRVPPSWTVLIYSPIATFGDRTGSASDIDEQIRFSDPAQGDASPWVFIYAAPIRTAFERHWYCQGSPSRSLLHASFNGLPAEYDTVLKSMVVQ